jgi:hypothetical protein
MMTTYFGRVYAKDFAAKLPTLQQFTVDAPRLFKSWARQRPHPVVNNAQLRQQPAYV